MGLIQKLGLRVSRRLRAERRRQNTGPKQGAAAAVRTPVSREKTSAYDADLGTQMADTTTIQSVIEQRTGPLLVNHWASWCTGCVDELPLLVALHGQYGKQVSFLGVSWEGFQGSNSDLVDTVDTFSKANAVVWDSLIVSDRPDVLFAKMKLPCQTIPQIWLFNAEGDVVYRCEKVLDEVECGRLRKAIEHIVTTAADSDD